MKKRDPPKVTFKNEDEIREIMLLYADPEIQQYIRKLNERYVHWDKVRHFRHPKGIRSEIIWSMLKLSRMNQYRKISIGDLEFKYVITDSILEHLHELDQKTSGTLESKEDSVARKADVERYLRNSIMEEAIASSQLEGAATTRKIAKEMLRSGKKPKNESQHMILNAYNTMLFLKEIKGQQLTSELICKIHAKMTANILMEKHLGNFRDNNKIHVVASGTGESVHHPPDYKKVPKLMDSLCTFINSKTKSFMHPSLKAIILHFMIGYIHPFEDGNGRTARALFYWYVLKHGYWLLEYMPISRVIKHAHGKYSRAYIYTENDENDLTYFIVFNLRQLKIALKEFIEYVKREKRESEEVKEILHKDARLNLRQSDIILRLMRHPLRKFGIKEIENIYSVVYQTARTDMELLVELGYCDRIKEGRKYLYAYLEHTKRRD